MREVLIGAVGLAALAGCGAGAGDQRATTAKSPAAPVKKQHVDEYATSFGGEQAERLFGGGEVDPEDLVGEWTLRYNRTLGILETRAPDGGGPVLDVVEDRGDKLVLRERTCPRGFVLGMRRARATITFTRERGRCPETIALLVEQPWRVL